jgi:hypothetical protein
MDDPWGSPWADESPYPLPKLDKQVSTLPVTPGKASSAGQDSKSPWDDNDGFGEWATLPITDELQANEQDGPEQAEIVEWNASVEKEFTERKDHIRPDGSSWFNRQLQPIDAIPLGLEIPKVTDRVLPPDPWVQEAAGILERAQDRHSPESIVGKELKIGNSDEEVAHSRFGSKKIGDGRVTSIIDEPDKEASASGDTNASIGESSNNHDQDVPTAILDNTIADLQTGEVIHGESLTSRPSSSPSDQSHHEVLTDSPRTSFEDEEKRPKLERGGSSKVKEMVRLFDSLALDQGSTGLTGHVDASDDRFDTPVAAQSEDDFGDFEEGISSVTTKTASEEDPLTEHEEKSQEKAITHKISDTPASVAEHTINHPYQPLEPHAPVQFAIDLSLLSQVLKETPDIEYMQSDPKQAPEIDSIIEDSFSSTNQRKTWYRISRFGTMRKHNAGDEDSYVRISWKDSDVRAETLKVVERWIEEDRVGGGVILGNDTRLGSMFGWGQKNGAPVSVEAALASRIRKTGIQAVHKASTTTQNTDASSTHMSGSSRRSLEQMSASGNSLQSPVSATAPQFSWSSGTPIPTTSEVMLPVLPPIMSPKGNLQTTDTLLSNANMVQASSSRHLTMSKGPSNASKLASVRIAVPSNRRRTSGDDDWGEMVSSSSLESPPPLNADFDKLTNSGITKVSNIGFDQTSERRSNDRMTTTQSGPGAFLIVGDEDRTITPKTTIPTAPKSDAWATADFSFFDSPAPPKPTPAPPAIAPKPSIPKPVPITQSQRPSKEQRVQAEQDKIVKSIVQNLPDLSYMLRR